jgi:hypothetical protein
MGRASNRKSLRQFEEEQAKIKAEIARNDALQRQQHAAAQATVNAWQAGVFSQLCQYGQFREFLNENFTVEQGIDEASKTLFVKVSPTDPTWVPDMDEGHMRDALEVKANGIVAKASRQKS